MIIRSQENKKRNNRGQWRMTKHIGNNDFSEWLWTEKLKGDFESTYVS